MNIYKIILQLMTWGLLLIAFMGCGSDEDFPDAKGQQAISFVCSTCEPTVARATTVLSDHGINDMVVYGINGTLTDGAFAKKSVVYDNYVVWHNANTGTWEYVGDYMTVGGKTVEAQRVKYWDYDTNVHYFWALAGADRGTFANEYDAGGRVKSVNIPVDAAGMTTDNAFYFSEISRVVQDDYGQEVEFVFTPYVSKVRLCFYETIPGFVVSNLTIQRVESVISKGTVAVGYDYENDNVKTSITPDASAGLRNDFDFGQVQHMSLTQRAGEDEDFPSNYITGTYIARSSDAPSYALGGGATQGYFSAFIPWENRNMPMTVVCSYTLTDTKSGDQTQIEGVTAMLAKEYCQWKPGYEYTYIFKLSQVNKIELDVMTKWQVGYSGTAEW